jgi:hypothetical protein
MLKKTLFVLLLGGCAKFSSTQHPYTGGPAGFAGANFTSTNSPCVDGIIVAIDESCAVPLEMEQAPSYIIFQCLEIRDDATPWHKYNIIAVLNPHPNDPAPPNTKTLCVDPHATVYLQNRP